MIASFDLRDLNDAVKRGDGKDVGFKIITYSSIIPNLFFFQILNRIPIL